MKFTQRIIEVDGHRVGVLEAGPEAAPRVILAHCSLAFAGLWRIVMTQLAERWRCVSIDMPGHGVSDRGDRALSLQLQAVAYVEGVAAATGSGSAHLVGLSLGGAVMGRVAVKRPDLTWSLTLIEPVYFHLLSAPGGEEDEENARAMAPVYRACADGRFHDGARAFMEAWGQPGQFDRMPEAARDAVARALSFLVEDFDMVSGWPEGQIDGDALSTIRAPVLLMQGERTQASAKAILDVIQTRLPEAERAEIAGAGHLSPVDDPTAVAARLSAFFERIERA
ncbi:alpha/beta fold hydrolase [Pikeienuella piscinae]|uniref:Alpha/beta fold hydrolase n=1 Tax=Pikeienuella piscinae TaxID=2748098 RepID=A0A7L5C0W0_9RHOB|nr:alpha/beta fold hydrolase [Pikeienuella piscinae]QIE55479.1 alpha/beta fold hydrolase [Pikeienuella piscinae]